MKKVLASVLVVVTVLLCTMSDVRAEENKRGHLTNSSGLLLKKESYGDWETWLGRQTRAAYMNNLYHSPIEIDMSFNSDGKRKIRFIDHAYLGEPGFAEYEKLEGKKIVHGKICVDRRRIYDVRFLFYTMFNEERTDVLSHGILDEEFIDIFLQEADNGNVLRIMFDMREYGIKDPTILEVSLNGFSDALTRCIALQELGIISKQ